MTLRIEICCDNAAFEGRELFEVNRILRLFFEKYGESSLEHLDRRDNHPLFDINGNRVGFVKIEE